MFSGKKGGLCGQESSSKTGSWDAPKGFGQRQGSHIWTSRPSSFLGLYNIRILAPVYHPELIVQIALSCQSSFQKEILETAMTNFIFSAGLLVLGVLLIHFAFLSFPFAPSFHTTSSHVQQVGISILLFYYANS